MSSHGGDRGALQSRLPPRARAPLVNCPKCDLPVIKLRSKATAKNPNCIFYKCPNNSQKWEKQYEQYLASLDLHGDGPDAQLLVDLKLQNAKIIDLLSAMEMKNNEMLVVSRMQNLFGVVCAMCMFVVLFGKAWRM